MSNAMRFGKRSLAAVAAGALGAALIPFVTAPAAQAAAPNTVAFGYPSATIIGTNLKVADETLVPIPVYIFDAAGDVVSDADMSGYSLEVTATDPATATSDDSMVVAFGAATGGTTKQSVANSATAPLGLTVRPASATMTWDTIAQQAPGTYTLTARLFVTGSGAVVSTATIPVSVVQASAAPAITFNWLNGSKANRVFAGPGAGLANANVINRLGGSVGAYVGENKGGASADDSTLYLWPSNATGGPVFLNDDSVSITLPSTTTTGSYATIRQSGFAAGDGTIGIGGTARWTSATSSATLTATYTPGGSLTTQSGTLTAQVGQTAGIANAPEVVLTTTPQYDPLAIGRTEAFDYAVPPGTTSLSFDVSTADAIGLGDDSFLMYNTQSNERGVTGGIVTSSGGRIAIRNDAGKLTLTLNAKAAGADDTLTLYTGTYGAGNADGASGTNVLTTTTIAFRAPTGLLDAFPPLGKVSEAVTIPGSITDQYGAVLPGTWAITLKNGAGAGQTAASIAAATAAADGTFNITVPASFAATTAGSKSFTLWASNGFQSFSLSPLSVTYTASGGLTSLTATNFIAQTAGSSTIASTSELPVVKTPPDGVVNTTILTNATNATEATTLTASTISAAGTAFESRVTTNPSGVNVTWSGSDGVFFTNKLDGSILYNQGTSTLTRYAADTTTVAVFATKPGVHTVTITSGATTTSFKFKAGVARGSGRTLDAVPTTTSLAPSSFVTVKAVIKDIYGNAVPDDTGVSVNLLGGGTLVPASGSRTAASNAAGEVFASYTAPAGTGDAQIQWSADNFQTGSIAGAPVLKRTATTDIKVGGAATKSIVIVGERATVSGKPGIRVEGSTSGFDVGSKMVPSIRFPGQSEYTAGTARPTTSAVGDFSWQRKTGKKTYVFFTNEAGDVKSNRVIIPAN